MKKTLLSTLVAGALMAGSVGSASAQIFYFDGFGGWVINSASIDPFPDPTYGGPGVVDGQGVAIPGLSNDLVWGTAQGTGGPFTGRSGARINDPVSLGHTDDPTNPDLYVQNSPITVSSDQPVLLGTLTHFNEPIDEHWEASGDRSAGMNANVATASVRYFFDVYSDEAKTPAGFIKRLSSEPFGDFEILFQETHNDGDCPPPNSAGSNCDDLFSFGPAAATDVFEFEGETYRVTLSGFYDSEALDNLTGTFFSAEGGDRIGFVGVVTHVPEPASIALLGLGLLGLGISRRRKHVAMA